MATVQHRSPVVVRHPDTDQFVTLSRGQEFADSDPIVAAFAWAFAADDGVESATAEPGKRRYVRRTQPPAEPAAE